jgi:bla regulator protein BlaR1
MNVIEQVLRVCAPAIVMAALVAAPAHANEHKKSDPKHKSALADLKSCAKPVYPADAIKAMREGTATIAFLVGADSKLVDTKVEKSSGHPDLDEATRDALKMCKFTAARQNGKPVQEWTSVQYVWSLK